MMETSDNTMLCVRGDSTCSIGIHVFYLMVLTVHLFMCSITWIWLPLSILWHEFECLFCYMCYVFLWQCTYDMDLMPLSSSVLWNGFDCFFVHAFYYKDLIVPLETCFRTCFLLPLGHVYVFYDMDLPLGHAFYDMDLIAPW